MVYEAWDVDGKDVYAGNNHNDMMRAVHARAVETRDEITIITRRTDGMERRETYRVLDL